jgi:hypothetical protein
MNLRRLLTLGSAAALLSTLLLATVGAGVALADTYNSPAHVTTTGDNTLVWTGQGTTNGELNSVQCSGDTPNPGDLLWIFTTDGYTLGSPDPVLTVNGTDYAGTNFGGSWHFVTSGESPDPALTDASVDFNVDSLGGGNLVLTISHGCPAEEAAIADIVTEVHDAAHNDITGDEIDLGSTVHDSATLTWDPSSASVPAGSTVTFYFFSGVPDTLEGPCTADPAAADDSEQFVLDGTETTPYSIDDALSQGPLGAGDYYYFAQFISADTDVMTNATSPCEPFSVAMGTTETVTELHLGATDSGAPVVVPLDSSVDLGSTLHDSATVTGSSSEIDPTGDVQFWFFQNDECDGDGVDAGLVTLVDGVADPSDAFGPLEAGDYSFIAEYLGDENYQGSTSDCEPFHVNKGDTETVTSVVREDTGEDVPLGGEIPIGTSVHDTATVGPKVDDISLAATDGLTYYFYENGTCSGEAAWSETVDVDADGVAEDSSSTGPLGPGHYSFNAEYWGNDNYNPSGLSGCEPFAVFNAPLTPGYWKNHLAPTGTAGCIGLPDGTGCSNNGPWTSDYLPQTLGAYSVDTIGEAAAVFAAMNCSKTSSALNCLAGHLLAAKLNVANGSNPCIQATIDAADAFLTARGYHGPDTYTLTPAQRATALSLKSALDTYNNGGGCP